jgi:hypothetical protein
VLGVGQVELISAQHAPPDLLDHPYSLYLVGSNKSNPLVGNVLREVQQATEPRFRFGPERGQEEKGDWAVCLYRDESGRTRSGLINQIEAGMWDSGAALQFGAMRNARTLGVNGRTVEEGGAYIASAAACGQSRAAVAGHTCGVEWSALGTGHGSAVAGAAG